MNNAENMRAYRARNPEQRKKDRWWVGTRNAALEQLAREYPERFAEILHKIRSESNPWRPDA